jgi:hypothetical protein
MEALIAIILNILGNRADQAISVVRQSLKKVGSSVQNELKTALQKSFLSAFQKVVLDCHKELYPHKFLGVLPIYPLKHRNELKWLDKKRNQLAKELKRLEQGKSVDIPFISFDNNNEFLLNLTDSLITEELQIVKEKLIAEALKDSAIPDCYKKKVKADLFEQVCCHFEWESNYNQVVHNFVMNTKLTKLIAQKDDATATITLDVDIYNLSTPQLLGIVEKLQQCGKDVTLKIRRIEAGSVKLILGGSQKGIRLIDKQFKSGQLIEILGVKVKDICVEMPILPPRHIRVNLSQWLQNIFEEGWQTVETILGNEKAGLAFRNTTCTKRAKLIYLGTEHPVVLTVAIMQKDDVEIVLRIHTTAKYLPSNLKLSVLDELGVPLLDDDGVALEAQARSIDNYIQLSLYGQPGEQFGVKVVLEDNSVIESFVI